MAKKGLGRGLAALMLDDEPVVIEKNKKEETQGEFIMMNISFVEPNREQPRKVFDEEELNALAESIKNYGIIQPITVKNEGNGFYSIIAGERRWRAAKMAGLKEVPIRIVEFSDREELEVALIENLQRTDLNPVEEAQAYKKLMEEYDLTQEDVSERVGKSRSTVANSLRLMELPEEIIKMISDKKLTAGHARAILSVKSNEKKIMLANKVVLEDLSVRATESLAKVYDNLAFGEEREVIKKVRKTPEVLDLEKKLSETFGTKVKLAEKRKGGKIEIEYYDKEQLETILDYLKKFSNK